MKILNGWSRIGVVLSFAWVITSTFIYVDEIFNHPSYGANLNLDKCFKWVDDNKTTEKAHLAARAEGKDFSSKYVFASPQFSFIGYFKLCFLPIISVWVSTYIVIWTFRWIREGFKA